MPKNVFSDDVEKMAENVFSDDVETMPKNVFSDDVEKKLIHLWASFQRVKQGIMKKRSLKEKGIMVEVHVYARELYGEGAGEFTTTTIHNKIGNIKTKALSSIQAIDEHYRRFKRLTSTGSLPLIQAIDEHWLCRG